jgi:hypothetical protein
MSRFLQVTDELRDLHGELSRLERVIADNPEAESLTIDLQSLSKRQRRLETEFSQLAAKGAIDVVRYRLVPTAEDRVPLRAMTRALDRFQATVSTIFAAKKKMESRGQRARLSQEVNAASGFDFGYSFAGSLGIVLTLPQDRVLFGDSALDEAMAAFFSGASATSREEVIAIAHEHGVSSVRRLYEWSAAHADFSMAADINWLRSSETRKRLQVAPPSLRKLKAIIEETSETTDEPLTLVARLPGLDTENRTFHMVASDERDIEGRWSEHFSYDPSYVLDMPYEADLVKRTKVHFAFDKEETEWLLVALRRPQSDL